MSCAVMGVMSGRMLEEQNVWINVRRLERSGGDWMILG